MARGSSVRMNMSFGKAATLAGNAATSQSSGLAQPRCAPRGGRVGSQPTGNAAAVMAAHLLVHALQKARQSGGALSHPVQGPRRIIIGLLFEAAGVSRLQQDAGQDGGELA